MVRTLAGSIAFVGMMASAIGAMASGSTTVARPAGSAQARTAAAQPTAGSSLQVVEKVADESRQQAVLLTAELKSLHGNPGAKFVWLVMIQSHLQNADRLAILEKQLGGSPDSGMMDMNDALTVPTTNSKELIHATLNAQEDLLKSVEASRRGADGQVTSALRQVEHTLRNHLELLRSLEKGLPITGA